jgi:membrane-associated protease RseP (regulator of RpoE activity)
MRSCRNLVAVAVTLGALAAAAHAVAVPGKIVVAPEAVVAGDTVRLTDIASLDGDGARALGDVVLSTAPGAGESRTLDGAQVLAAITRAAGTLDGLKVVGVSKDGLAGRLGLQNGDVLEGVNNTKIESANTLLGLYAQLETLNTVELEGTRHGKPLTLTLRLR